MKNKNRAIIAVTCLLAVMGLSVQKYFQAQQSATTTGRNLGDEALLALIKNDLGAFKEFVGAGGDLHGNLPLIDGKTYTVAEGLSYFERPEFVKYLQSEKKPFVRQGKSDYDVVSLAVTKNNPELLKLIMKEKPNFTAKYGAKDWNLMHIASAGCAFKVIPLLHQEGKLDWSSKAKDGSTPITLAAQNDCLGALSYFKEMKADFHKKDGRGLSAMSILRTKKDAALLAFVQSFEVARKVASVTAPEEMNFYKKRKIPKDQMVDHSALVEPEIRPLEAVETAEHSEFAD